MDAFGQDLEKAVEDPVPLLGVDLLGELHRAGDVGEEHGHLLPLALDGGPRGQDAVGEVLRGVGAGVAAGTVRAGRCRGGRGRTYRRAAGVTEPRTGSELGAALRAARSERAPARVAEARADAVGLSTGRAK